MYERYFGFTDKPFALTPDPRFLFLSEHHREAMAHLLFGMGEGGGFVQLTGEVGTGKTTLCRSVLERPPEDIDFALILNPALTPLELVGSICDELGIPLPADTTSMKELVNRLNHKLLENHAAGRRTVVVIDEAQNLSSAALEQVRLLTNLETPTEKLLQMVLIGQPELQTLMERPDLRQLAQRITARYHLPPLGREESAEYVRHRLRVAGGSPGLFTPSALRQVHRLSGGVPRLLNIICDRALLGAYGKERTKVTGALVREAWREVSGVVLRSRRGSRAVWATGLIGGLVLGAAVASWHAGLWPVPTPRMEAAGPTTAPAAPSRREAPAVAPVADAPIPEPSSPVPAAGDPTGAFLEGLQEIPWSTDRDRALSKLLSFWLQRPVGAGDGNTCREAVRHDLHCFEGRGAWTHLLHYNRPAVVELHAPDRSRYFAVLVAVEGEQLFFQAGDSVLGISRDLLEPLWFGSFTSFWAPPPGGSHVLADGSRGADVVWLRERLAAVTEPESARNPDAGDPLFNGKLRARVLEFQREQGLTPDGIAGRETIMRLNALSLGSTPLLVSPKT